MLRKVREGSVRLQRRWRKPAYENLKFYQDICQIRKIIHNLTERFSKNHFRLVSQMRDAARSAKQNIREGYRKGTVGEYSHSIKISLGSLEELSGDIEDCLEDGLISNEEFDEFSRMFQSATYMANQFMKSLYKMEREGTWKVPGEKFRK
ncbi:MAG: four helix bundle protein [Candidatus Omnitrophota bacterium]